MTAAAILGDTSLGSLHTGGPRQVSVAVSRISLRGKLDDAKIEVHYTTDSSEPTAQSPLYSTPFLIHHELTVKALILRDGQPYMTLSSWFRQTDPPFVTDPRWATDTNS